MTSSRILRKRVIRRLVLLVALLGTLIFLSLSRPTGIAPRFGWAGTHDFAQYWSAARLLLRGEDPYDSQALFLAEQSVGWPEDEALRMWNPPWTLALVLPVAWLPFGLAAQAWLVVQLVLILVSGLWLWRRYATGGRRYWVGLLVTMGFVPCLLAWVFGQISPWMLAGTVGFLWAEQSRRDMLAGVALSLLLIKPQVAYLFWLAALWWAFRARRWGIPLGSLASAVISCGLVSVFSPGVFGDYFAAMSEPPLKWATPTLGFWLRLLFGLDQLWLQYLPSMIGVLMLSWWLIRSTMTWDWMQLAPPLLLASAVSAAFGWSYDQVILLPGVIVLVARQLTSDRIHRLLALAGLISAEVTLLALHLSGIEEFWFVWHAALLAIVYWWDMRSQEPAWRIAENRNG